MKTDYEIKADAFASKYGVKLSILGYEWRKYFPDDSAERYAFKCRLSRGRKSYTFTFGQSLYNGSKEPTMYDILSCLTKWDCGTFEDFCAEFGYDTDSRKAERAYKGVCKEYSAVVRLFGDSGECYEELCTIS